MEGNIKKFHKIASSDPPAFSDGKSEVDALRSDETSTELKSPKKNKNKKSKKRKNKGKDSSAVEVKVEDS